MKKLTVAVGVLSVAVAGCPQQSKRARGRLLASIRTEIGKHLGYWERRMLRFLKEIPASGYDWRPAEGRRTARAVALHAASANLLTAARAGLPAPADLNPGTLELEKRSPAKVADAVKRSCDALRAVLRKGPPDSIDRKVDFYGRKIPLRVALRKAVMHFAEHVGQLIVYRRVIGAGRSKLPPKQK